MDQVWQETLLAQKRIPHRISKSHASAFDVRKLFGRHQVTCAAATKDGTSSQGKKKKDEATLELYRLSDDGQGVLGELHLPGVLTCEVALSGSRKSLAAVIDSLESHNASRAGEQEELGKEDEDTNGSQGDSQEEEVEAPRPTFEKNSFRNPKFWLRFKSPTDEGTGYLVFSGNDCRRFKGTLSCEVRGWDNIAISGWKAVGMSERDVLFRWGQDDEGGVVDEEGTDADGKRETVEE